MILYISDEHLESLKRLGLTDEELHTWDTFLASFAGKGKPNFGQLYLTRLLINSQLRRKDREGQVLRPIRFAYVLTVCQKFRKRIWRFGTPGRWADPDDLAPTGRKSTVRFSDEKEIEVDECHGSRNLEDIMRGLPGGRPAMPQNALNLQPPVGDFSLNNKKPNSGII